MGYRWLDNYTEESDVIETAPGVFKVMLINPDDRKRGEPKKFPIFGVSKQSIIDAIKTYSDKEEKLKNILNKMNKET